MIISWFQPGSMAWLAKLVDEIVGAVVSVGITFPVSILIITSIAERFRLRSEILKFNLYRPVGILLTG